MEQEIKLSLKQAILKSLPLLHELSGQYQEPYLVWSKRPDGGWQGSYQHRTSVFRVFRAAEDQLQDSSKDFASLFFSKYSDYGGGKLVGCAGLGSQQLAHDKAHILKKAIGCLWNRFESFDCSESDVDVVVGEFEDFVESPKMRIRFQAQLLNFTMSLSALKLTETLNIRKLNEGEISALHGGPAMSGISRHSLGSIHEFVIEGDYEGTKVVAGSFANMIPAQEKANSQLDKAVLCLRAFKEGYVGYQWIDLKFTKFCPLDLGSYGSSFMNVPPGIYKLSDEEAAALPEFAQNLFALSESALESACARLADAEARFRPQDQILDAVIGMEALLLAGLGKDDRRSELKYRFSLNFSALRSSPEDRWRAYNVAKDLYDHRSTIAHGGKLPEKELRIGEEKVSLHEAAKRAKGALRTLIKHFLPQANSAPYKKPRFWEHAYFGILDGDKP
ncbi:MAG TPA: hypothetical protein VK327_11215 [Candidatus Paceibacterota bacterium]|nr:hypothetical protein [Candidatus Paceibacterota bacterium]